MKPKFFITTTIGLTLFFFKGQARLWKETFDVTAISGGKEKLVEFAESEKINYKYLPIHREINLWSDFMCLIRLIVLFLKERPTIVHGNTPKASLLSMLAAWMTRCPIRIYMCHGLRYQGMEGMSKKLLMAMEKLTCGCATQVISVSKGVADMLVSDGLCKKGKVKVMGHGGVKGIDLQSFNPDIVKSPLREEYKIKTSDFVYCFMGRIVRDKGVNELVHAFQQISNERCDCHLFLLGNEENSLNAISEDTRMIIKNNGYIHALKRQDDVRPFLKASDAFVFPSYREGFGIVLIEAAAMGLPCIATNIIGCNDLIVNGVNGDIVEPRNIHSLYVTMKHWVEDRSYVKKMAAKARKIIVDKFESEKVAMLYYEEYKRLAQNIRN